MDEKIIYRIFLLIGIFTIFLNSVLPASVRDVWDCTGALGKGHEISCIESNSWIWDEDKDGNVSLELELLNRYDYIIKNVTLNIKKCAGEIKIDAIKSGEYFWENESVLIKTNDICIYEYYDFLGGNYFWSNATFSYFDENNSLKSYKGEFMFPVQEISQSEYIEMIKKQQNKEKILTIVKTIIILTLIFFIIYFIAKKLFRKYKK